MLVWRHQLKAYSQAMPVYISELTCTQERFWHWNKLIYSIQVLERSLAWLRRISASTFPSNSRHTIPNAAGSHRILEAEEICQRGGIFMPVALSIREFARAHLPAQRRG